MRDIESEIREKENLKNQDFTTRAFEELSKEQKRTAEEQKRFERFVIGLFLTVIAVLLAGLILIIIEMAMFLVDFRGLKSPYYINLKNKDTQQATLDNLQNQKLFLTSIRSLEEKIEKLEISIGITKSLTDVTNGQKLLTNSVQNLEKELKQLYQNEKGIANILTEQKVLVTLVRNLKEELGESKALYRIEKNTDDIIHSQNKFINSFQNLEEKVHKLTELSQDDTSSKIEEELKNILQSLENNRTENHYQKIIYH